MTPTGNAMRRFESHPERRIEGTRVVMAGRPGVTALYGDDVWDLAAADYHGAREAHDAVMDFRWVPATKPLLKEALKELGYHRLNTRLSPMARPVAVYTAVREQVRLKRLVRWLDRYHPEVSSLRDLTQAMVHAYRRWLENPAHPNPLPTARRGRANASGTPNIHPSTVWAYLGPLKSFDNFRRHLSTPMGFRPYGGELTAGLIGWHPVTGENSTEVIPPEILRPLVSASMLYLDRYAPDVRGTAREKLGPEDGETLAPGGAAPGVLQRGPAVSNCPVLARLERHHRGLEPYTWLDYRAEFGHAVAASLVLILFLSGMRPGEVAPLDQDCLRAVRDRHTGEVVRWKVVGVPEKKRMNSGRKRRAPKVVEWVVPEPAARAIGLLRELYAPFRERFGSRSLLLNLDVLRPAAKPTPRGYPMTVKSMCRAVTAFQDVVRAGFEGVPGGSATQDRVQAGTGDMPDGSATQDRDQTGIGDMPDGNATPAQFRRTLARHIARQPFGIIAGKLQYKHVSAVVFEGYAGDPEAGFRTDLAEEQALANIDLLDEIEEDAEQGALLGPGAERVARDIRAARKAAAAWVDATDAGVQVTAALRSIAVNLHVGVLNFCVFDPGQPERALCLTEKEKPNAKAPRLAMCSPGECPNSVVGACHVPKWLELIDDAVALKAQARSTPQRVSLEGQIKAYRRVLKKGPHG